jgi:hypothetical protein
MILCIHQDVCKLYVNKMESMGVLDLMDIKVQLHIYPYLSLFITVTFYIYIYKLYIS